MKATAVKFSDGAANVLDILAVPFGGPINGRDTDGEYFSDATDLCLDWYPVERPLLFGHGMDGDANKGTGPGVSVIGRVDSTTARKDVDGWWVQAQLDASNSYFDSVKKLVDDGKLFASSGAMPHLVKRGKSGELLRWPWAELSLTPTPANLYAVVEAVDVAKHYKSAGIDLPAAAKTTAHTAMKNHFHTHTDGTEHSHAHEHTEGQDSHDGDGGKHAYSKSAKDAMTPDPDQVPADGDNGDAPEGSCEDWLQDLNRLLNRGLGGPFGDAYAYTVATFGLNGPGYAIVCVGTYDYDYYDGDNDRSYYRVEFDADDQSEPVLGAVTPMDRVYIPAKSTGLNSAEPLILAATTAIKDATIVRQRTRDLAERRIKEGRTLSTANVQRLQALQKTLTEAAGEIGDLLGSATPPAKAADGALLQMLELRTRQSRLRLVE